MTARIGSTSMDGTPISDTDRARIAAEDQLHHDQQRKTVRVVAAASQDAQECRMLLAMLGIDDETVAAARAPRAAPAGVAGTAKRKAKSSVAA